MCSFVLFGALVSAAQADSINTARVIISPDILGGTGPADTIDSHVGVCDASANATGGANSSGNGLSYVTYGNLRGDAHAIGSINAQARGIMHDMLTFSSSGSPSGTTALVTYRIEASVDTLAAPAGGSGAIWHFRTNLGISTPDFSKTGTRYSPDLGGAYSGDALGTYSHTVSIQLGTPTQLYIESTATADSAFSTSGGAALADITNFVVSWAGIVGVTVNGSNVPFTVSSASGTNWTGAITPCAADLGGQGGVPTPDGLLDNNDFVVFIDLFFSQDTRADLGSQGGVPGSDGQFDNNDFVAFIDLFFAGC